MTLITLAVLYCLEASHLVQPMRGRFMRALKGRGLYMGTNTNTRRRGSLGTVLEVRLLHRVNDEI